MKLTSHGQPWQTQHGPDMYMHSFSSASITAYFGTQRLGLYIVIIYRDWMKRILLRREKHLGVNIENNVHGMYTYIRQEFKLIVKYGTVISKSLFLSVRFTLI